MNIISLIIGIACIGYGIFSIIFRIKSPEKFTKLEAMKKRFGDKAGMVIHIISYTILPILGGIIFLIAGILGISIL